MRSRTVSGIVLHLALGAFLVYCAPRPKGIEGSAEAQTGHYVCPPCGSPCDDKVYDHPGSCPVCGMKLVAQGSPEAAHAPASKRVAILVFDGAEIIDFTGPYEVFGAAGFDVYTVAQTPEAITTAMGMKVVPKYAFANAPAPAVLVVPGGGVRGVQHDATTLAWVKSVSGQAEQTMSVCNGAFILASAGLLDGLTATTTYHLLPQLGADFPHTSVARDRRFVDNGKIITTAGLSSGIDGALHVVSKMLGRGAAQRTALGIEYDWHEDAGFVRAALADRLIPDIDMDRAGTWTLDTTEGTRDAWVLVAHGTPSMSDPELGSFLDRALTRGGQWRRITSASPKPTTSEYRFEDEAGHPWIGTLTVDAVRPNAPERVVKLSISRTGS